MGTEASSPPLAVVGLDRRRRQLLTSLLTATGTASALSALTACGGGGPDDDSTLRAVNATVDVASIDVQYNLWLFAGAVGFGGSASGYASRNLLSVGGPRGQFEVRRAGGTPVLLRDTKSLPNGDTASVVVMGDLASGLRLRVVDEDAERPGGTLARLRFLHAWPAVGALDAYVTRADQTLTGREPSHRLVAYDTLSLYADVIGEGRLRITPAGRSDQVLFDAPTIGLAANQVATLVVAPAPGATRVAVAVLPQVLPAALLVNTLVPSLPT